MPRRIQLPNGQWIYVPDIDPYVEQILSRPPPIWGMPFGVEEEEEEEDEGTLAGSAWEGFKSIPSGVADVFLSGLQATIGVATPFADLPVEKRLRKKASKRARERDPAYQDAFLPAVGTGLGQVGALSALSRLPGGWYVTMGAGVGMGISEQTRRIADYEQRTGINVPWYKESAAHMMGALIGLTEVVPIKGMFPVPIAKMVGRMQAGLSPNSFRHASKLEQTFGFRGALGQGLMEATQEASAQWLQAISARGLYDPNAMEDIARSMAEDFKVGGAVGAIAKLVQHQLLGAKFRRYNINVGMERALKGSQGRRDRIVRDIEDHITGISDKVSPILRELNVDEQVADDITNIFGGEDAILPLGFDEVLRTGRVTRLEVQQLVEEFETRNTVAKFTLDNMIEHHRTAGNYEKIGDYERAKIALDEMITDRIKGLRRTVSELGGRLGELGGISGTAEYRNARQEAIETDTDEDVNVVDIHFRRRVEEGQGRKKPSFVQIIRSLMGGSFGVGGLFKMGEMLGVHGGIGSEKISTDVDPDFGLASSDESNFDLAQVGEVIFTASGAHELSTKQRPVDNSDVLDGMLLHAGTEIRQTINDLDRQIEDFEESNDGIYRNPAYSFTRELAEVQLGKKFDSDEAWKVHRGTTQQHVLSQVRRNNLDISRVKRERNIFYLRLLDGRLREVRDRTIQNPEDKEKIAERVFGTPDTDRLDLWLDKTIATVKKSAEDGQRMSEIGQKERDIFMKGLAARTDISEETKVGLEAKFLAENAMRNIELPRDISASQFIKIADLFIDDPNDADKEGSRKRALQSALIFQGLGNISNWKIEDMLYEVEIGGVPVPNDTRVVVERFIRKLGDEVSDEFGKVTLKEGDKKTISADDIVELLQSKNIYLRDGKRIGKKLAKTTGVGVESRPFKKLLFDMTGAPSWEGATYAQRLLMYSRLLQLPAHYRSRGDAEERSYLEDLDQDDYRPLFLPDFYYDPSIDNHVDFVTDRVVDITTPREKTNPSLSVDELRKETSDALGEEFNSESFDEAVARLIESGVFKTATANKSRVRFNVSVDGAGTPGVVQPGDSREIDRDFWEKESNPEFLRELLEEEDARWSEQLDSIWASYQEKNPDKPLTRKEFIDIYTPVLTSSVGLQELSDQGILDTIVGAVTVPGRMAPTGSILELGTPEGRSLVQTLMQEGALPSSMRDNVQALRRRFIDTMKTRFEVLDKNFEQVVKKMRLPDNIQRQYVDDADGLFQFLGEVAIRGEVMEEGVKAMYDRPGNRIIINLAAIDPNNMVEAQDIVRSAAFHEGLHALFIRDHLSAEELDVLYNFVRNSKNVVPEEIDEDAYNADLTWFERSVVEFADSDLAEGDIEKEAVTSLLENLVRHPNVFGAQVAGKKVRKIGNGVRGFLEGFVDAVKDANIVDVMRILGRIESGAVGDRGAGYLGDTENTANSMIRSNDLLRYANPKDIERLRAAVVLRDAAPSDEMRANEQAKVDDIADKIIANKGIIQESAPSPPDAVKAIENQRKLIKDSRDTHSGSIPLIGLDQEFKDSEAYKLALDTFMEMRGRDPRYAYKMPDEYQTFFDTRPKSSPELLSLAARAKEKGNIGSTPPDATRESLGPDGVLSGYAPIAGPEAALRVGGEDVGSTKTELEKWVSEMRYNYLDRRQWVVEQTDRLIAAQNRAQLDAETSALVMWRNSDNAVNFLRGLMIRGPLSYLGRSVGAGNFENAPVYDNDLQEKYGGDGRVRGLNDIIAPIIDSADQETALIYGIAKRIEWTKGRRDSLRLVGPGTANLDPETKLKWKMFEKAYQALNPSQFVRKKVAEDTVVGSDAWWDKLNAMTEEEAGAFLNQKPTHPEQYSVDELNDIITEVETNESNKHIIEFWDHYNAYDNHMIKMSYNAGMITREQRDEWLDMPYAPFYRELDEIDKFPIGSQQELAQRGINLVEKALEGSKEPITTDLVDSIIRNTQALVRDAMMNVAVSRTVRDAVALEEAKQIGISGMAASVNNSVVRVMEDGVPVFYELDDAQLAMSTMMLGFNPKKQLQELFGERKVGKGMQKALTGASSLLREAVTRTPPFAMKNVFRDAWTAMSITGGGPKLVLDAFTNALDLDSLRRADELGLSIGIDFLAEQGEYTNKMRKELKKANLDWRNPLDAVAAAWHFTGRISQQSEVATRLAVYDRILAQTGDKALAMHYAVEIMNYGRRGKSQTLSTYMSTVPFMNGRLQGMDVTYRGLRSKKGSSDIPGIYGYGLTADEYSDLPSWKKNSQQILGRGLALTFATWALYMLMRDDEEWQDLREEVKSDNWVLPLSDHAWLKIPIPFEIGVLFKVIPEKLFEAVTESRFDAGDVGKETIRQIQSSMGVAGLPQLFAPIVGAMRNYDAFRKDKIVDAWMEETLSPNEQRNAYTSNVARGVADLVDSIPLVKELDFLTSPMKVEYMMRQYVGTAGGYAITLADRMARTGWLLDLPFEPWTNLADVESVIGTTKDFDFKSLFGGEGVVNVPILGDLLTDPRTRGGRQQQFALIVKELDTIIATLNSISDRDYQKGFKYKDKHMNVYRYKDQIRFIENQMRKWRERRDHLSKVPPGSMSKDEERAYHQRLLESRHSILASVNTLMASIKEG